MRILALSALTIFGLMMTTGGFAQGLSSAYLPTKHQLGDISAALKKNFDNSELTKILDEVGPGKIIGMKPLGFQGALEIKIQTLSQSGSPEIVCIVSADGGVEEVACSE
jgi:hypothetical protein